ncbi:MAG TPA: dihydrofolate reductase family protein [Solirubrobacteraceae bacterium]|jgi:riboflavin biosynthesis pyrimidine reductase
MIFRRLLPEPGEIDGAEAVAGLAGHDVLAVNMVCSADGRAAFGGVTAPLSDPADRELFHLLRAQADAILVGTGTLRTERYGRMIKDQRRRAERAAAALAPEPVGVTLTRSLDLPYDIPLFAEPEARVIVYTSSDREPQPCAAQLEVIRLDDLSPPAVIADLRARHGVRCVLCEGGPTLNGPLFGAGVVDELFLTISPVLVGGVHPLTILEGELDVALTLDVVQALEHDGTLLLRYRVRPRG